MLISKYCLRSVKGTVSVISNDLTCKDGNARFCQTLSDP